MKRLSPAVILFAAAVALAGCTAGPTAPTGEATNGGSSSSPSTAPEADDFSDLSPYYPIAQGNTWVYTITFSDASVITDTEVMSKVVAEGDGARVTFDRTFHHEDGSAADFSDTVDYVFRADGSLSVPFQSVPADQGTVTVKSGALEWPTTAEFEAGTPKTGTIEASFSDGTNVTDEVVTFTITGEGIEDVTVPFGSFSARKLHQSMLVAVPSFGITDIPIDATTWLAENVGPVRTVVPNALGGEPIVQELVSFTEG